MHVLHNKALVLVDPEAKAKKKIKTPFGDIELHLATDFSWDSKVKESTNGILVSDFKGVPKGTEVIFNHRATTQDNEIEDKIFLIDDVFIYFYMDNGEPIPFDNYYLIKRINKPRAESKFLHIPDNVPTEVYDNIFEIVKTPKGSDRFNAGQRVIAYRYSDYAIPYAVDGVHGTAIRLKEEDILALYNEQI